MAEQLDVLHSPWDTSANDLDKRGAVSVKKRRLGMLLIVLLVTFGCKSSIGTKTVRGDQFDYAEALRDAWKEQMLLNMVGLRYAEAPMFLKVSSVINQYSLEGSVAAAAPPYTNQKDVTPPFMVGGRYSDSPTITYTPLSGAEFTRSVMTPIPHIPSCRSSRPAGVPIFSSFSLSGPSTAFRERKRLKTWKRVGATSSSCRC